MSNPGIFERVLAYSPTSTDAGSKAALPEVASHVDVRGKIALVTGANAGVGFETSVHLARMGCMVVMCCRNMEKASAARKEIMKRAGVEDVQRLRIVELDLSDLDDVGKFTTRYEREMGELSSRPIDMTILNAGIMAPKERQVSKQGFESQLAVNVLGHFRLLAELMGRIKRAEHGRIVFVASQIHLWSLGRIDFDDLNREKSYWKWIAYAESKLGTLLVMERLNRLLVERGIENVLAVAAHPGYAATNIHTHAVVGRFNNLVSQSADKCAKSIVAAAVDPEAQRNGYCGPAYFLYGDPSWGAQRLGAAHNEAMQDRFWAACEDMTHAGLADKI